MTVTYQGWPDGTVMRTEDGVADLLSHHVKHSPTGFAHGYLGSGPAELARCLLIDALGDDARCPDCHGTNRIVFTDPTERSLRARPAEPGDTDVQECYTCDVGFAPVVERNYQTFKAEVVAGWPQHEPWTISRTEVRAWLAAHPVDASTRR